jgi:PKD repeat protein
MASGGGGNGGTQPSENQKPVADLSAGEPYQGLVNTAITFDGSKSKDPDGTITKWSWNFGDNTSGTGKTVTHIYSKIGTYTITLTVTDNESATDTDTTTCTISHLNRTPTKPTITGPINGTKNTKYTYTAVSTDADNDTIKYTFNWGDPLSLSQSSGFLPNGTSYIANHSWAAAGRYNVKVTATDNHTTSSSNITVYIDAVQTGNIGYLMDNNGDGIYDAFYSDTTKQITAVQEKNGSYSIDSDGDGDFDYTYSTTNGLTEYQAPLKPSGGIEPVFLIGIIIVIVVICGIVLVLLRKNKRI